MRKSGNMPKIKDIKGHKFNMLEVIEYDHSTRVGTYWKCKCDCGNSVIVQRNHLISGHTKSCGCLNQKKRHERTKQNNYDLSGEFGIGYTTNTNAEFYFDLEDYDKIKKYCWMERVGERQGYIVSSGIQQLSMHRYLINASEKIETIDHINHNVKDNRKSNLREATYSQNNRNRGTFSNNTIGERGIYQYDNGTYRASIVKDGHEYAKTSKNLDVVKIWRRNKERELYGEWSYDESRGDTNV